MLPRLFTIEKCDEKTIRLWRSNIQIFIILSSIIGYFLIRFSPFVYFFHQLGFEHSNGCPLYTFTGIPCPACGMGRGLTAIMNFHFDKWFYYNPSAPFVVFPSFLIILCIFIISFFRFKIKLHPKIYKLWYLAVIVIAIVWILNIFFGHIES